MTKKMYSLKNKVFCIYIETTQCSNRSSMFWPRQRLFISSYSKQFKLFLYMFKSYF